MKSGEYLKEILDTLKEINEKIGRIARTQTLLLESSNQRKSEDSRKFPLDVEILLDLPDHLRETALNLGKLGSGTADQVAAQTGRTRAAESDYLNQLVKMGHLKKERRELFVKFRQYFRN